MKSEERRQTASAATTVTGRLAGSVVARQPLLQDLACPACTRPLQIEAGRQDGTAALLVCASCGRTWPLRQRTPFFTAGQERLIPAGPTALLHSPDVEHWEELRRSLERADPALYGSVFDGARDDWRFLLPLSPGANALVLGCGWGRLAASLADICERVYAVDSDPVRARFVNARAFAEGHGNLLAVAAGFQSLPFHRGLFQLIVLEEPMGMGARGSGRRVLGDLARLRTLLAPGGMLLVRCERKGGRRLDGLDCRRWQKALRQAGFPRVDGLLALPDCATSAYVLQASPDVDPGTALRTYAGHYLEPATASRRAARWLLQHLPLPGDAGRLFPGHWLLASSHPAFEPAVFAASPLPPGPWGLLAARGRPFREGQAQFMAFDPATARPHFLVKVARARAVSAVIDHNFQVLERLHRILSPELLATIPPPLGRFAVHGYPALAQGHLEGVSLECTLRAASPGRQMILAADLLATASRWLSRFHYETARFTVLTEDLFAQLVLGEISRGVEACSLSPRARGLFTALAGDARLLIGQRLPLVCEHREFQAEHILLDEQSVRVPCWDLALFNQLPLGDFYDLVHSLAFRLGGAGDPRERAAQLLQTAYGGSNSFAHAVGICLEAYCARLGIRPEWGRVILPLRMLRQARLGAEQHLSGKEPDPLAVGVRYLDSPIDYPYATGLRYVETGEWEG